MASAVRSDLQREKCVQACVRVYSVRMPWVSTKVRLSVHTQTKQQTPPTHTHLDAVDVDRLVKVQHLRPRHGCLKVRLSVQRLVSGAGRHAHKVLQQRVEDGFGGVRHDEAALGVSGCPREV